MTKTLSAAAFKATCLEVLDTVAASGQEVVVTKRGRPVARVVPMVTKPKEIVGAMRGTVQIAGDIVSPVPAVWKALKR